MATFRTHLRVLWYVILSLSSDLSGYTRTDAYNSEILLQRLYKQKRILGTEFLKAQGQLKEKGISQEILYSSSKECILQFGNEIPK